MIQYPIRFHSNLTNAILTTNMVEELQAPNNIFFVSVNGEIESALFPFYQNVYCKYSIVSGPDWVLAAGQDPMFLGISINNYTGVEEGISQMAKKGFDEEQNIIWNLPLSIIYKSSNISGWPQIVISVYGLDIFGNDVVRGYGVIHIPVSPGHSKLSIPMFVPESSTAVQKFTSWLTGKRPEFTDPRILTQGDSREVARVKSEGFVNIIVDTTVKGLSPLGYIF